MNYLQLCQRLRQECINVGTGPSTVTGQTGKLAKLVTWVADSWKEIQLRHHNWRWMRSTFTVNTVVATDSYAYTACTDTRSSAAINRFGRWWADDCMDPFKCFLASEGIATQYRLIYTPWPNFKYLYRFGAQIAMTNRPIHVSVDEQDNIVLGPSPNGIFTVIGDYQRGAQILAADADTPDILVQYHDLIVYHAMQRYGADSVAAEVYQRAVKEGGKLMRALERAQLPEMRLAEPMA